MKVQNLLAKTAFLLAFFSVFAQICLIFVCELQNNFETLLGSKISVSLQPVFTSKKVSNILKSREPKPNTLNKQCVVYYFQCGLFEMDYVRCTKQHLYQHNNEHTSSRSLIGKHVKKQHGNAKPTIIIP